MSKNAAAKTCRAQDMSSGTTTLWNMEYDNPNCDQMSEVRKEVRRRNAEWYHQITKQREEKKKSDNDKNNCVITDEVPEGTIVFYSPYRVKDMRDLIVNKK
jgi:hypothetical protein